MLNRYPLWKNALIILLVFLGILVALPNLYGEDPSVQISPTRNEMVNEALRERVQDVLTAEKIETKRIELGENRLLIRFHDPEQQLKARDLIARALKNEFSVALNLAPDTPLWLQNLGLNPMYLGLDLRGGVHFLMEIDIDGLLAQVQEAYADDVRTLLKDKKMTVESVTVDAQNKIVIQFPAGSTLADAKKELTNSTLLRSLVWQEGASHISGTLSDTEIAERRNNVVAQNINTLRKRINELGVAEPIIQQQGAERIVVQLPGVQDTARAKEILGATATLEFRMVDERNAQQAAQTGHDPLGTKLFWKRATKETPAIPYLLKRQVILTGDSIINATAAPGEMGQPMVNITLDSKGADRFGIATKENLGKPMATVFIENKVEMVEEDGKMVKKTITTEEIANVATIQSQLFKNFQITGLASLSEANDLALVLRAGSLAAPIRIVEERTVGPSAGKQNIEKGFNASVIAMGLVMLFMVLRYRTFGMVANIALVANLVLLVALLSLMQATLTLPGIAGIILTLGMAVDANVLIYERIREDLGLGMSPQAAIDAGFNRAFATIADANLTGFIASIVLFGIGSGPIKGFAVTLTLGIITSMFTSVWVSRAIINRVWGGRQLESLPVGKKDALRFLSNETNFNFIGRGKACLVACMITMVLAIGCSVVKGFNFGLDFTGGTTLEVSYDEPVDLSEMRTILQKANINNAQLQHFGSSQDVMIRIPPVAEQGSDIPDAAKISTMVLTALQADSPDAKMKRVEFVGPQVGDELISGGSLAALFAVLGILIYLILRFEWKLAAGSVLSTLHDTVFVVGLFSLFWLDFDLSTLAAVLAVIGYSVNDTVVVLDRIRENFQKVRHGDPADIVNSAINQTMSRTIMTSMTTFIAVLVMYFFGGAAIESFALAMIIGVVVGTYSSIFIAASGAVWLGLKREDLMPKQVEIDDMP